MGERKVSHNNGKSFFDRKWIYFFIIILLVIHDRIIILHFVVYNNKKGYFWFSALELTKNWLFSACILRVLFVHEKATEKKKKLLLYYRHKNFLVSNTQKKKKEKNNHINRPSSEFDGSVTFSGCFDFDVAVLVIVYFVCSPPAFISHTRRNREWKKPTPCNYHLPMYLIWFLLFFRLFCMNAIYFYRRSDVFSL